MAEVSLNRALYIFLMGDVLLTCLAHNVSFSWQGRWFSGESGEPC